MAKSESSTPSGAFAQTYGVELLYEAVPKITKADLLEALKKHSPDIAPLDERDSDLLAFAHREHLVKRPGGVVPAQVLLLVLDKAPELAKLRPSLDQSWSWPQAVEVLPRCRASVAVTDVQAAGLPYLERLLLFENVLASVLEKYPCLAIHWRPTQQFVKPADFLAAREKAGGLVYLPGPVNVRLFHVEDSGSGPGSPDEEFFMDTLGLAALGLPDLQCHFRGLDTQAVSRVLYNTAIYLFQHGPVIEDGHTVPGIRPDDKWTCRRMDSISLPDRPVIDLDPGPPHAAGKRE